MRKPPSKRKPNTGKKQSSRRRDSWEDRESRDMKKDNRRKSSVEDSTNDPRWYATDPALLRDSSSIPFSWPLGQRFTEYSKDYLDWSSIHEVYRYSTIPGVCVVDIVPTMGAGLDSDALNVAAACMYSYVRHTNSGHANYDPNDLMLYVVGMTQVYAYINWLERIYAISTLYEQRNRYLPDALFKAQYIDADSIKNNLSNFRYAINVLINKVSSIAVPATMTLFLRQAMLYAYVYSEGESVKDQLYLFNPVGFYKFQLDSDSAGMLQLATRPGIVGNLATWQDLIDFGNALFTAIWDQEDFGIMSGDILKSYGSNILSLTSLNEVVPFAPVVDYMVLHQIKNATVGIDLNGNFIRQSADKSRLYVQSESHALDGNDRIKVTISSAKHKVLTLDAADPDPSMVIEATRLMHTIVSMKDATGTSGKVFTYATGSEAVSSVRYLWYNASGTLLEHNHTNALLTDSGYNVDEAYDLLQVLLEIKAFKFAPELIVTQVRNNAIIQPMEFREVDNYAVLDSDDVQKMHTAAMLNMLNVPSAAKNVQV